MGAVVIRAGHVQPVWAGHMIRIDIDLVHELVPDDVSVPLRMVCRQPDVLIKHERASPR